MIITLLPFLDGWSPINTEKTISIDKGNYETISFENKGVIFFAKFTVSSADTEIASEGFTIDFDETPSTLADSGQTRDTAPIYLAVQTAPYVILMNKNSYTNNTKITISLPNYSTDSSTNVTYELRGIEIYDEGEFINGLKEITPTIHPTTPLSNILSQIHPKPTEEELIKILNEIKNAHLQTLEYLKKLTFRW